MAAATPGNDKTVNKVALCSAIFAGFAYVGYSVVRTAFCRKLGRREGEYHEENRLYFRRLSQTTQTDILLGNLDTGGGGGSGGGRIILRPLSVQERIRELNLRARQFADTMLAIQAHQANGPSPRHTPLPGPRSLQVECSPWSSPRILSPVDVRHFLASRSTENLMVVTGGDITPASSPLRRKWSRRSLAGSSSQRHSPEPGALLLTTASNAEADGSADLEAYERAQKEAEKMLRDGEEELRLKLDALSFRGRVMTIHEAKSLVALLYSKDDKLLERTLVTIGNCATFSANQDCLREAGCLLRLQNLLTHHNPAVRLVCIQAMGNMALNQQNQRELKNAIPILISFVNREERNEKFLLAAMQALTNVAALPDWHDEFYPILHDLYALMDGGTPQVKLQALKLLVNLSVNEDMVPSLLAAQAPRRLIYLLDLATNEDILLRVVTLLANLTSTAKQLCLDPTIDLPAEDKAASPETMYASIYGVNTCEKMRGKAFVLMNQHKSEDVRVQARRMYEALKASP